MRSEGTVSDSDKGASALACPGRREAIPIAEGSDQLPVARVPDTYLIVTGLIADAVQTLGTAWAQHSWLHDACLKISLQILVIHLLLRPICGVPDSRFSAF